MSEPNPEWLILAITLICLALAPLASKLVKDVGNRVSGDAGGDQAEDELDPRVREDEIAQMLEARAYVRRRRTGTEVDDEPTAPVPAADDGLREEVRQMVVASNERRARMGEEPLDVEPEVDRRLARLRGDA